MDDHSRTRGFVIVGVSSFTVDCVLQCSPCPLSRSSFVSQNRGIQHWWKRIKTDCRASAHFSWSASTSLIFTNWAALLLLLPPLILMIRYCADDGKRTWTDICTRGSIYNCTVPFFIPLSVLWLLDSWCTIKRRWYEMYKLCLGGGHGIGRMLFHMVFDRATDRQADPRRG